MRSEIVTAKLLDPTDLLKNHLGLSSSHQMGDLGCGGAGYFTIPAARLVGNMGKVYAVDILKSALDGVMGKMRLENLHNIETVWSDLEKVGATKIPDSTLDSACLINILFQSRNNENLLQEACRLLKVGGKLLLVDWKVEPTPLGPPQDQRLSPQEVDRLATKSGFSVTESFEAGPYHYGLILEKK